MNYLLNTPKYLCLILVIIPFLLGGCKHQDYVFDNLGVSFTINQELIISDENENGVKLQNDSILIEIVNQEIDFAQDRDFDSKKLLEDSLNQLETEPRFIRYGSLLIPDTDTDIALGYAIFNGHPFGSSEWLLSSTEYHIYEAHKCFDSDCKSIRVEGEPETALPTFLSIIETFDLVSPHS